MTDFSLIQRQEGFLRGSMLRNLEEGQESSAHYLIIVQIILVVSLVGVLSAYCEKIKGSRKNVCERIGISVTRKKPAAEPKTQLVTAVGSDFQGSSKMISQDGVLKRLVMPNFSVRITSTKDKDPSLMDLGSFKAIPDVEKERFSIFRGSCRLSQNTARINELLGLSSSFTVNVEKSERSEAPIKPAPAVETLVPRVCANLSKEIMPPSDIEDECELSNALSVEEAPPIHLESYLARLVAGINKWYHEDSDLEIAGVRCLLLSLIYVNRVKAADERFHLTDLNVHRLFAVMFEVAAKYSEDAPMSSSYWAEISSLEMSEVTDLENLLCDAINFDFFVVPSDLGKLYEDYGLEFVVEGARVSVERGRNAESSTFSADFQRVSAAGFMAVDATHDEEL